MINNSRLPAIQHSYSQASTHDHLLWEDGSGEAWAEGLVEECLLERWGEAWVEEWAERECGAKSKKTC